MLTVLQNAYLRLAEKHPEFGESHKKIMLLLICEQKHYTRDELLCMANYSENRLAETLKDLEAQNLIKTDGWLVKLSEEETLEKEIVEEYSIAAKKVLVGAQNRGSYR